MTNRQRSSRTTARSNTANPERSQGFKPLWQGCDPAALRLRFRLSHYLLTMKTRAVMLTTLLAQHRLDLQHEPRI